MRRKVGKRGKQRVEMGELSCSVSTLLLGFETLFLFVQVYKAASFYDVCVGANVQGRINGREGDADGDGGVDR